MEEVQLEALCVRSIGYVYGRKLRTNRPRWLLTTPLLSIWRWLSSIWSPVSTLLSWRRPDFFAYNHIKLTAAQPVWITRPRPTPSVSAGSTRDGQFDPEVTRLAPEAVNPLIAFDSTLMLTKDELFTARHAAENPVLPLAFQLTFHGDAHQLISWLQCCGKGFTPFLMSPFMADH